MTYSLNQVRNNNSLQFHFQLYSVFWIGFRMMASNGSGLIVIVYPHRDVIREYLPRQIETSCTEELTSNFSNELKAHNVSLISLMVGPTNDSEIKEKFAGNGLKISKFNISTFYLCIKIIFLFLIFTDKFYSSRCKRVLWAYWVSYFSSRIWYRDRKKVRKNIQYKKFGERIQFRGYWLISSKTVFRWKEWQSVSSLLVRIDNKDIISKSFEAWIIENEIKCQINQTISSW